MKYKDTEVGIIPESWEVKPIKEVTEIVTDYVANGSFASLAENVKYKDEPDEAVLIRLVDYNNEFNGNFVFIDSHAYEFLSKSKLFGGEIIISNVGANVGTVFRCPKLKYKMSLAPNSVMVTFKENDDFYFHWLRGHNGQSMLKSIVTGSAQPKFNKTNLREMLVPVPPIEVQDKIANILNTIDDKIEINKSINKNLEQQAQALFKSWFVDFEPFSNRKPNDWSISTLGSVSIMGAGGDKPQNVSPIKTDLYEYPIYSNGLSDEGLYGFTDKPKISEESVTVSARGTIGFVCLRHIPYMPIVRLVTLIPKTEIISAKYLYLWLKQFHIAGTGTTQQQLTVPDFQKTEILVPSQENVTLFTATVEPIFEKIWANQIENEKLSSLRDTLLPRLVSGELDVSNIDL